MYLIGDARMNTIAGGQPGMIRGVTGQTAQGRDDRVRSVRNTIVPYLRVVVSQGDAPHPGKVPFGAFGYLRGTAAISRNQHYTVGDGCEWRRVDTCGRAEQQAGNTLGARLREGSDIGG